LDELGRGAQPIFYEIPGGRKFGEEAGGGKDWEPGIGRKDGRATPSEAGVVWCEAMLTARFQSFTVSRLQVNGKVNYPTSANSRQKWGTRVPSLAVLHICRYQQMWVRICGRICATLLVMAMVLGMPSEAPAQTVKRLILADGSYQAVTEWKVEGERVRYFSAERSEWEELPKVLVDWKATDEWNSAAVKSQAEELKQVTEEEMAAHREAELNTPRVAPTLAPELRLPAEGGVFVLEMRAGKPALQQLQGVNPKENRHETANRLKKSLIPVPLIAQVQTIELQGASAKVRLHSTSPATSPETSSKTRPEIFVDVEDQQGPIAGDSFRVVRLERRRELRVVATTKMGLSGENVKQTFVLSRAERFSGNWWKLVLLADLTPGEYAIVIADTGGYRSEVAWDFGVDK